MTAIFVVGGRALASLGAVLGPCHIRVRLAFQKKIQQKKKLAWPSFLIVFLQQIYGASVANLPGALRSHHRVRHKLSSGVPIAAVFYQDHCYLSCLSCYFGPSFCVSFPRALAQNRVFRQVYSYNLIRKGDVIQNCHHTPSSSSLSPPRFFRTSTRRARGSIRNPSV